MNQTKMWILAIGGKVNIFDKIPKEFINVKLNTNFNIEFVYNVEKQQWQIIKLYHHKHEI